MVAVTAPRFPTSISKPETVPNSLARNQRTLLEATSCDERPEARAWLENTFRLDRFSDLLIEALRTRYGVRDSLIYPFALSRSLRVLED